MTADPRFERLKGARALVRLLAAAGVTRVYGLASGKLGELLAAIADEPRMTFLGVRHEASAAMMATAHFAATGEVAICLGETGPGGLNLLSGLGGAHANHLGVLAITSSNPSGLLAPERGAFSTTDNHVLAAPIVRWSARATDAARLPELARAALRAALGGAPGPALLDVPADVLGAEAVFATAALDASLGQIVAQFAPAPSEAAIAAAASLLNGATRPLLIGGGGMMAGAAAFRRLADALGAPVVTTQMGLGLLNTDHPLLIGRNGTMAGPAACRALAEADVVLALGCRFSSWMWPAGAPQWGVADQRLIHVDVDPAAIGRNHAAAVGIVADAGLVAAALADRVRAPGDAAASWRAGLQEQTADHRRTLETLAEDTAMPLHPAAVARVVGQRLADASAIVFDGGHTTFWSHDFTPASAQRSRFNEPGMSQLGFGIPYAIAIQQARPGETVVCITGDGAFGFTMQELDTARRYGLPIIVVVHNNAAWGVIDFAQRRGGFSLGTSLSGTDYAAVARGLGCYGRAVETLDELDQALHEAQESGLPAVIDVHCRFVPHPMISVFGPSTAQPRTGAD